MRTNKERYFTPENLKDQGQKLSSAYAQPRQRARLPFLPQQSALLVLDMQSYFLDPASHAFIPSAPAILPGLNQLAQAYAAAHLPLFFTRHTNIRENAGVMASWWRDLIDPSSPLSQITPELEPGMGTVIDKHQYDAFYQTDLHQQLRHREVTQVVIGGVMTHLCCETTARSAFMRGFQVFFLLDGVATYHEAFHRSTLLNLSHGFAVLMRVDEVLASLTGAGHV